MSEHGPMPKSAWMFPLLAVVLFVFVTALNYTFAPSPAGLLFSAVLLAILFGTVFAAVHHAEVIAHRIGEPFGTLLLTLSVTIIEVALIATLMLGEKEVPTLARDTVFAVIMIVCNGLVGVCIFIGGLRYGEQDFQVSGANVYLSVLIAMATISLVLPNYTLTTPGPVFSEAQLEFVSVVTILLYTVFLYIQTVRHRDYFIGQSGEDDDSIPISGGMLGLSIGLLLVSLLGVVLLAKKFSIVVDAATAAIGAPPAIQVRIGRPRIRPSPTQPAGKGCPVRACRALAQRDTPQAATMPTSRAIPIPAQTGSSMGTGTRRPRSRSAESTPIAMWSLATNTADPGPTSSSAPSR